MKSIKMKQKELINAVKQRIEQAFPDSVVIWTGTGCPDDENDDTENFEALWIEKARYAEFQDLVWKLEEELAEPAGYYIMVHALSPEVTKDYRWKEYQDAKQARCRVIMAGWYTNSDKGEPLRKWKGPCLKDISLPEGQISGQPIREVA